MSEEGNIARRDCLEITDGRDELPSLWQPRFPEETTAHTKGRRHNRGPALLEYFHGSLITGKRKGRYRIGTENRWSRPSRSEETPSHEETSL
jgi:hypothetical protein